MFYVYEWFIVETGEIIYVGKGCRNRYKATKHNRFFNDMIKRYECKSRIIKYFETEKEAFNYEYQRVNGLKEKGQCVCNIYKGGCGGTTDWWTEEKREWYSEHNCMKSQTQRHRMSVNNPMKTESVKKIVSSKKHRKVIINGTKYNGVKIAAEILNVAEFTIITWCKRGYDTYGNPCRYENEQQKEYPIIKKSHPNASTLKPVIIDGIRFETVKDGAKYIGVWAETLIRAIKNNRPCKGHSCEYDNQQPIYTNFGNSSIEGSTTNR